MHFHLTQTNRVEPSLLRRVGYSIHRIARQRPQGSLRDPEHHEAVGEPHPRTAPRPPQLGPGHGLCDSTDGWRSGPAFCSAFHEVARKIWHRIVPAALGDSLTDYSYQM
jgi:hypothetical protein